MATILVPVDLDHESSWRRALPAAVDQARLMGGKVYLLNVVPHITAGLDWRYAIRGETGGTLEYNVKDLQKAAKKRLGELMTQYVPPELQGQVLAPHGTIYDEIVKAAERLGADLIVMASHRPSLKDYLLGPNAARVARHARSSVHIVRE
jgi:nucleotide-binding universal stress UspA family protein